MAPEVAEKLSLKETLLQITKDYGSGVVIDMSGGGVFDPVEMIPSGILTLDKAIGGGIPRGTFTEIVGPESAGKSTLCLHLIAEAQKLGPCLLVDTEHAYDPVYAAALGVDNSLLYISQPDNAEQALEVVDRLARTGEIILIVIDSVAGLVTQAELNGQMGDAHIAGIARLMGQCLRKLTPTIGRSNTAVIFTNQLRAKIGGYGSAETTTGGNSLKYFAALRIDLRRIEQIKTGVDVVGSKTKAKIIKNKHAVPQKLAEFDIIYGEGVSKAGCVLDVAVELKLVAKKGAYFMDVASGENLGQGRPKSIAYLQDHPDLLASYYAAAFADKLA